MSNSNQSSSQKSRRFAAEPMGTKCVTAVPGIGNVHGDKLRARGYNSASTLYGEYLVRNRDGDNFSSWMKDTCGAGPQHVRATTRAFDDWTRNNL